MASITSEVIACLRRPPYRQDMATTMDNGMKRPIGDLLREWRERRRLSQLALALDAEVSTRHLSFLETGRARPSREMVLRLAEQLEVPLRERNAMLLAAGFAPAYPERDLDDPALGVARAASRPGAGRARTVPCARGRPLLDAGRRQPRRARAVDRRGARTAPAADQRPASQSPPGRVSGADRESPRVAGASPGAIVSPGGAHRRSAAFGSAPGAG